MKQRLLFPVILFSLLHVSLFAQEKLTVEKIITRSHLDGKIPSNIQWDEKGQSIYFSYRMTTPQIPFIRLFWAKVKSQRKSFCQEKRERIPSNAKFNLAKTKKVFVKNGKSFYMILPLKTKQV